MSGQRTVAEQRAHLRKLVGQRSALVVPGASNALNARIIEDLGYEAAYVTGAGVSNAFLGMPDLGLLTVTELAETTARIADVCSLPLVVDIDTGFGNALNVYRTVRTMERAGASALQLEDQTFPKKCGHFADKAVVPLDEMLGKLRAALDARDDPNLQIIARTDARAVEGFERAMERGRAFIETGADIVFIEAPLSLQEIETIATLPAPLLMNIVIGGKTPMLSAEQLKALGFSIVLYANAALQATIRAVQEVLGHLHSSGSLIGHEHLMTPFEERQHIVQKEMYDALEQRYRGS